MEESFFELGGDSLSAIRVIAAINTALGVRLKVAALFDAPSVRGLSQRIERTGNGLGPEPRSAFRVGARTSIEQTTEVHAGDLTLDKFIDATTLAGTPALPGPSGEVRTVLLTGATGFVGRYLVLQLLEQMELVDGTLICLVRADSDEDARRRLDTTFGVGDGRGDPALLRAVPGTGRRSPGGHRRRQG